jgi:hypothetical protein
MEGAIGRLRQRGDSNRHHTAGAQAAVRQPSTTASGRGDARKGGYSPAIPTSHSTATAAERESRLETPAQRVSSTAHTTLDRGLAGLRTASPSVP